MLYFLFQFFFKNIMINETQNFLSFQNLGDKKEGVKTYKLSDRIFKFISYL